MTHAETPENSSEGHDPPLTNKHLDLLIERLKQQPPVDMLQIREDTLDELSRAPMCALTLAEGRANPLIHCREHSGETVDVFLTIADRDPHRRGVVRAICGTLRHVRTTDDSSAESTTVIPADKTPAPGRFAVGSEYVLSGSSEGTSSEPVEKSGAAADDFAIPAESEFELTLNGLPEDNRLATAEVQRLPVGDDVIPRTAGRSSAVAARLNRRRLKDDSIERTTVPTTLAADSATLKPFVEASSEDGNTQLAVVDESRATRLTVDHRGPITGPLVAEVTNTTESGPETRRYILWPDAESSTPEKTRMICNLQASLTASTADVAVTLRRLYGSDACLLNRSDRDRLLEEHPLSCLTVRGLTLESYRLTVFDDELADVAEIRDTSLLFRLVPREGGEQ